MSETFWAIVTVFGLGIAYFVAAIPAGVAMRLDPAVAALSAWAGYSTIAAAMLGIGTRLADGWNHGSGFPLIRILRSYFGVSGFDGDCRALRCSRR